MVAASRRGLNTPATVIVALLAGYVVLLALFPSGALHSNPPQCFSTFNYRVPCGPHIAAFGYASWSFAAGATMAAAVGFALRRSRSTRS